MIIGVCGERLGNEGLFNGYGVSVWDYEKVVAMDDGSGFTTI